MSKMVGDSSMSDVKKFTALIVDDNVLVRKIEQAFLNKKGFETKFVENGKEVVNIFNEGNSFDVVIMEMKLPVMDEIQATKELRAMGVKCLIFGMTTSEAKSDIQSFIEAGLDECFPKPLDFVMIDKHSSASKIDTQNKNN
ncbi:two-component response regulator ARR22-like [Chenopodium quinoa]|uniref:Response regulatory domain-containing protein n=1 Tax=Chenopodium quinoa TaxID=63459 RepID=A0A803LLW9_CHEQI|nr:two-component response regulator ARR22-like [Chenopodium quinoa]